MRQFTTLTVKTAFTMKNEGSRGRAVNAKVGDVFVTTSVVWNDSKLVQISRPKGAQICVGYYFPLDQISKFFDVEV